MKYTPFRESLGLTRDSPQITGGGSNIRRSTYNAVKLVENSSLFRDPRIS